jgi:hypothetical protein
MPMLHVNRNENSKKTKTHFVLQSLIAVVPMSNGYVIYWLMVVLPTMVNIGVCVRLIYVIPVILHLFAVC